MPTLDRPTTRQRFSSPIGPSSHTQPTSFADTIVTNIDQNATTGNSVEDHLKDLIARSGHGQATEYATGTNYAVGAEVYWVDTQNATHFYLRLVAGQDPANSTPNNLPLVWREVVNNLASIPVDGDISASPALLEMGQTHKAVRASVPLYTALQSAQSEEQVTTAIEAWVERIVDDSSYRGDWEHAITYAVGDIVEYSTVLYRRRTAGQDGSSEHPDRNATDWATLAGLELQAAQRLKKIHDLPEMEEYRGSWTTAPAITQFRAGDVVFENPAYYICETPHRKQSNGPSHDSNNWSLLTSFMGNWSDRDYQAGSIVRHSNNTYIAHANIRTGNEQPGSPDDTKWDLLSTRGNYRGEWARDIAFQQTIFEGDILYHDLTERGHSSATEYDDSTAYRIGDEVYWDDGSSVRHYYLRLTDGTDSNGDTPNTLADDWREILDRAFYICKQTHFRTSFGPDTDPQRFDVLTNYVGEYIQNTWYQQGHIVTLDNHFYIAQEDIDPSDPLPTDDDNTKWIGSETTGTALIEEYSSPTIGHENRRSFLRSPGRNGIWSGPGLRETSAEGSLLGERWSSTWQRSDTGWTGDNHDRFLKNPTIDDALKQFFTAHSDVNRPTMKFRDPVPNIISMAFSVDINTTTINRYQPIFKVYLIRAGASDEELAVLTPIAPGGTSETNLYHARETIDVSNLIFQPGDQLAISYWFQANSREISSFESHSRHSTQAAEGWIQNPFLYFYIDGEPVQPDKLNTDPVQARPLRSRYSYDPSLATGVTYTSADDQFQNVDNRNFVPMYQADGTVRGNGWELRNDKRRGYRNRQISEIYCNESSGADLSIVYTATCNLEDHDTDSANPDQVRFDLMKTSRTADAIDLTQDEPLVPGGFKAFDIAQISGTVTTSIASASPYGISYTLPDSIGDSLRIEHGQTGINGIEQSLRAPTVWYSGNTKISDRFRLRIKPSMRITSRPGPAQLQLFKVGVDQPIWRRDIDNHLSHGNPTEGSPANIGTDLIAYDSSSQQQGVGGDLRQHFFRIVKRDGAGGSVDYSGMELSVEYEVNRGKRHLDVSLAVPSISLDDTERVYVLVRNTTETHHARQVYIKNQKLQVANVSDLMGRDISLTGSFGDEITDEDEYIYDFNALSAESAWWDVVTRELIAKRDIRQVAWTLDYPAWASAVSPIVKVWRQIQGLDTREEIGSLELHSGDTAGKLTGVEAAWVAGESIVITSDHDLSSATFGLSLQAQAPTEAKVRQVHTEGILRNRRIVEMDWESDANWHKFELINHAQWHFADQYNVTLCVEKIVVGASDQNAWDIYHFSSEALSLLSPLEDTRIGQAHADSDQSLDFWSQYRNHYIRIAPVENGEVAMAIAGNGAAPRVRVFVE